MRIILLQHGEAVSGQTDAEKCLSVKGTDQARRAGFLLESMSLEVKSIIHSDKMRAIQTAEILAAVLAPVSLVKREDIGPKDPVQPLLEFIQKSDHSLLVVGHMPFLRNLAESLLSLPANPALFDFTNCSPLIIIKGHDACLLELYVKNDLIP